MNLMSIDFFQFDNLVKNRVPFILISYGIDFKNYEKGLYQNHIEKHLIVLEPMKTQEYVESQNLLKEQSIVLVDQDGRISEKWAETLDGLGYKNVFFIRGGFENLQKQKARDIS